MCFFNVTQNAPKIYDGGLALTENPRFIYLTYFHKASQQEENEKGHE